MSVIRPERLSEIDEAAAAVTEATAEVEGEIREFVRRDISVFRRHRQDSGEAAVENISSLIQRVSSASVAEIDRVINELNAVRDMLRNEGDRVQREITQYASLSQAAMSSMKVITDSLSQWNAPSTQPRQSNG
jgi:vacuolar-type H+-ATPase subunit I/STV1